MKGFVFLLFLCSTSIIAQEHAWVYFKNKPNAQTYLDHPNSMLTQRALDRRSRQNIMVNTQDVPLEESYVLTVKNSQGITVKAQSKWLNAIHVIGNQTDITNLKNLSYVDYIQFANKGINNISNTKLLSAKVSKVNKLDLELSYNYGNAANQTTMLGIDKLHDLGFDGSGMQIAVIDGGFYGVNTAGAFSHLLDNDINNGEILGGYDFVNSLTNFYLDTGTSHGTNVLSTIGAIKEDEFRGMAPKAGFYLFVTEDAFNEVPLEESLWVQAAERADSLGVDIINTSLGYNQFDDSKYNYNYADMDGETTFITRGANIAAQKGMVIVNSAGNSGANPWKYITAPADAKNVIAVGAVNPNETITFFSSFGPTADQRIKPETLAQGGNVYVVSDNNDVYTSNGTSFSGPIIAGAIACLWQAYPEKSSLEIREMVIENSGLYNSPTDQEGYGILNVTNLASQLSVLSKDLDLFPFDVVFVKEKNIIQFEFNKPQTEALRVQVFSVTGAVLEDKQITQVNNQINYDSYKKGVYFLRFSYKNKYELITLYKID